MPICSWKDWAGICWVGLNPRFVDVGVCVARLSLRRQIVASQTIFPYIFGYRRIVSAEL